LRNYVKKYLAFFLIFSLYLNSFSDIIYAQVKPNKVNIAVLNFTSQTGSESIDAMLSIGTAETIMTDLSNVSEIEVIERSKIRDINNEILYNLSGIIDEEKALKAGLQVGADYLIIGGWQKFGINYRINARIVEVETGIVKGSIKQSGSDIFLLQDNIVSEILKKLNISPTFAEALKIKRKETQSVAAYQEYSQGLQEIERGKLSKGRAHMKNAIVLDPNYENPKKYVYYFGDDYFGEYSSKRAVVIKTSLLAGLSTGVVLGVMTAMEDRYSAKDGAVFGFYMAILATTLAVIITTIGINKK